MDSDRYIIDVDQLDLSVGGADCTSTTPTIGQASKDHCKPSSSDHKIPVKDHVSPRSGGDIKLLRMTSSTDHMTSTDHMISPVAMSNTASRYIGCLYETS